MDSVLAVGQCALAVGECVSPFFGYAGGEAGITYSRNWDVKKVLQNKTKKLPEKPWRYAPTKENQECS